MVVTQVIKMNGETEDFDKKKIVNGIYSAAKKVGGTDEETARQVADRVVDDINRKFTEENPPRTSDINCTVEYELIKGGHISTLKSYIIYRFNRVGKAG